MQQRGFQTVELDPRSMDAYGRLSFSISQMKVLPLKYES